MKPARLAWGCLGLAAAALLLGSLRADVVGPEFEGAIEGREFEPESAFARIDRDESGDSVRIFIDDVASDCDELDEVRGSRIVLGPFVYRPSRSIPAATANAIHVAIDPSGGVHSGRFTTGDVVVRGTSRDAPAVPFAIALNLDDVRDSRSFARGDVLVTPCVLVGR